MTRRNWAMMGAAAAVWGASYMFIKLALDDFSEGAVVCIRTALGAAVLLFLAARWNALAPVRGRLSWLVVISLVQIVGPFLLITVGETKVESQLAGILVSSTPIFATLLAIRFDQAERLRGWGLAGILVGMLGVVLLFGLDLSSSSDQIAGGLMVLLASLGYAVGAMLIKHRMPGVPPVAVAGGNMAISALLTLPLALATFPDRAPGFKAWGSLVLLGAFGTGIAFLWFYTLIKDVGPTRASIIGYLGPAFSVAYGVTLLDEAFSVAAVGGLALILAGSWLAVSGRLPSWATRSGPSRSSAPAPERAQ